MGAAKNTAYKNGQKQKKCSNIKPDSELLVLARQSQETKRKQNFRETSPAEPQHTNKTKEYFSFWRS